MHQKAVSGRPHLIKPLRIPTKPSKKGFADTRVHFCLPQAGPQPCHDLRCTRRLSSSPPIPSDTHAPCLAFCLPSLFAKCSVPSTTRMPSTNPSRRGMSRGSLPYTYALPLVLSTYPLRHARAVPRFCLPSRFAECRVPSTTRGPSTSPSRRGMSRGSRT